MKDYKNIFFDKIGYQNSCIETLLYNMKRDKRNGRWRQQRKKYGNWDERATWNLNTFLAEHTYIWFKLYYKYADRMINLDFYKFSINGKELTERECIKRVIADIRYWLKYNDRKEKEANARILDAYKIIGIIFPVLWW